PAGGVGQNPSIRDIHVFVCSPPAMQQVMENLKGLPSGTAAQDMDLIFLTGIMESPIVRSLAKAHERLEVMQLTAVGENNMELVTDILESLHSAEGDDVAAAELTRILEEPHFQCLIETHDNVAVKSYEMSPTPGSSRVSLSSSLVPPDAVRMIGIQKRAGEPLGVTFRVEGGAPVIRRILHGSAIARQGLLHVGDVILEVDGHAMGGDPKELQELLKDCSGTVTLKVLPSYREPPAPPQVFLKPHFKYNPATDNLIPCREVGLAFSRGDVLHVVNKEDPNWWQATNLVVGDTGLIPSQFLEEKRKAFVRRDWDSSGMLCGTMTGKKKKKKMMYLTSKNAEFDRYELQTYEEVARMPPFQRKTLVLIGAQGVGRRSLKNRLIVINPLKYGTTVPSRRVRRPTSTAPRWDSIHEVVDTRRTCILDVNPQALKVLKTAEFMPFVVFIAAPELDTLRAMHKAVVDAGLTTKLLTENDLKKTVDESARIRRAYSHYFDLTIVNDHLDKAFDQLQEEVEHLCLQPQWVPVSWVF
uniref:Protein associated with LIN7 2, MAGUK p55 family member a n=1 Tax=Gadus morhua TaxID=8049 RepID=A0A8C4Z7P9_GADMO